MTTGSNSHSHPVKIGSKTYQTGSIGHQHTETPETRHPADTLTDGEVIKLKALLASPAPEPEPTPTPEPIPPGPEPTPTGANLADYGGNWLTAIETSKTQNKTLIVPSGSWPAPVIRPYAGLRVVGAGKGISIVPRSGPGAHAAGGFFHVTVPDFSIEELTLRGWTGTSDDILINPINATRIKVLRVSLENAKGCGIQPEGVTDSLFEDIDILNTQFRDNGYHGVALWPYNGAHHNTFRRILIDGADYAGLFLDAGTTVGTAAGVDDNVFEDITIRRAARKALPAGAGIGAGWMVTGARNNHCTRFTITDQTMGAALAFGTDQSGLTSTGNVFKEGVIARTPSAVSYGGQTGNTVEWVPG